MADERSWRRHARSDRAVVAPRIVSAVGGRRPRTRLAIALVVVGLVAGACSSDDGDAVAADSTTTTSSTSTTPTTTVDQRAPRGLNGVVVDGDRLWVASIVEDAVLGVDRESGEIVARVPTAGAGPDDVAVGPGGEIWVTGYVSGNLGVIRDGAYSVVASVGPVLNPVAVAQDGTVFVGLFVPDSDLYQLDVGSTTPRSVARGLDRVNAFAVDADGNVLAPVGGDRIVRIDPSSGQVDVVVEGLFGVLATDRSDDGRYVALGNLDGKVFDVDVAAGTATEAVQIERPGPFDNLAFAEDGTMYVTVLGEPAIVEITPDGTQRELRVGT